MKIDLEQASLLYLGKLLSNDSFYTEQLEDTYISFKNVIEERDNLKRIINELKNQPTVYLTKYLDELGFVETKTLNKLIEELEMNVKNER